MIQTSLPQRSPRSPGSLLIRLALAVVVLAALAVRLFGLDWDEGQSLHPDERFIIDYVMIGRLHLEWPLPVDDLLDPGLSGLNPRSDDPATGEPRSFAYGTLPLYVTEVAAEVLTQVTGDDWHWRDRVYLLGRFFSVLLDTGTVLVTYFLGKALVSRRVGLLAAIVAAAAPMSIQLAHFFTTDSWLTFFVALTLLFSIHAASSGSVKMFALAGAGLGLSLATKGSVFALGAVIAVALLYDLARRWRAGERGLLLFAAAPERAGVAGIAALIAFAIFEPYALARPDVFWASFSEQADIHRGYIDVPFTRQYVGTSRFTYHLEQFVRWGFGPFAGLLSVAGVALLVMRLVRGRGIAAWVLLTWLGAYGLVIFLPESKFIRYLAPLAPVLAVTAALAIDQLWRWAGGLVGRIGGGLVGASLVAGIALWGVAFSAIFAGEHPRLAASRWLYENVPAGSVINGLDWDDTLPVEFGPGITNTDRQYQRQSFNFYTDAPSHRDLALVGAAFSSIEGTRSVGSAIEQGDYRLAALAIERLAGSGRVDDPGTLAGAIEEASASISPSAGGLKAATGELGRLLRIDGAAAPSVVWETLAAELLVTADREVEANLFDHLANIDYFVISSNRVPTGIANMPWRYPVQGQFFKLMHDEALGFDLVYEATNYPRLGPVTFADDSADEAWLNYDHPHVWIFAKREAVTRLAFLSQFSDASLQASSPTRYPPDDDLLLVDPVGSLPVVDDARWSAAFTGSTPGALIAWVALLVVLQVAGWPLASMAFARFADGGWGLTRIVTLVIAGFVVWFGASVEVFAFRAIWSWLAVAGVAALGWTIRLRWRGGRALWRSQPGRPATARWAEGVFWGAFALFLAFRFYNPDSWHPIWGGEKPMEFAHLNAILRSAHFTPFDPWFSQGYINYYYYGIYLVAFMMKLAGIPSEIAFNLAQPTMIALLASAAFSVAAALARDLSGRRSMALPGGVLGALLMVGIGNLTAFFSFLDAPATGIGDGFGYYTWSGSRAIPNVITEFPYFTGLYADLHAHVVALPITVLVIAAAYALAKEPRLLTLAVAGGRGQRSPRFAIGLRLGIAALGLGTLSATNIWDVPVYLALVAVSVWVAARAFDLLPRAFVTVVLAGGTGAVAYGLFLPFFQDYVTLFGSLGRVEDPTPLRPFVNHFGGLLAIAGLGLVVTFLARARPRAARAFRPLMAIGALVILAVIRSILPDATSTGSRVVVALTVMILAGGLIGTAWAGVIRHVAGRQTLGPVAVVAVVTSGGLALVDRPVMGLMVGFFMAGAAAWLFSRTAAGGFVGALVTASAAIVIGTEVVFLADNLAETAAYRMNTVFKFYNQGWVMLALAAAALVARLGSSATRVAPSPFAISALGIVHSPEAPDPAPRPGAWSGRGMGRLPLILRRDPGTTGIWAQLGLFVAFVVVAASLFYPALATGPRLDQRFAGYPAAGSLNGIDWMDYGTLTVDGPDGPEDIGFAGDRAAIDWFNENVEGSPVIVEASIGPYRGNGSRIAIHTGLPAVIGWDNHETQQRYAGPIFDRVDDVEALYRSDDPDEKMRILSAYDVEYVVVGELERHFARDGEQYATPEGIAAFDAMAGTTLEIVFEHGETTIYRVVGAPENG